jgi:hypothetical protein
MGPQNFRASRDKIFYLVKSKFFCPIFDLFIGHIVF